MEKERKKEEIKKEEKKGWFSVIPLFLIISLIIILMLSYALYTEKSSGKETPQASGQTAENTETAGNAQDTVLSPGCKDTDGDNLGELGVVYLVKDDKRIKYVDRCLDKHTVKEYFCSGADAKAKIYKCASICTICREDASADPTSDAAQQKDSSDAEEKLRADAGYTEEQETKDNESIEQTEEENQQDLEEAKDNTKYYYNCKNGFKDTFETDVDCGGTDCSGCAYNKRCELNQDCAAGLKCDQRLKRCMR